MKKRIITVSAVLLAALSFAACGENTAVNTFESAAETAAETAVSTSAETESEAVDETSAEETQATTESETETRPANDRHVFTMTENSKFDRFAVGMDCDTRAISNVYMITPDSGTVYEDLDGDGTDEEISLRVGQYEYDGVTCDNGMYININGSEELIFTNDYDWFPDLYKIYGAVGIADIDDSDPYKELIYITLTTRDFVEAHVCRYDNGSDSMLKQLFSYDTLSVGKYDEYASFLPFASNGSGNVLLRTYSRNWSYMSMLWWEYPLESLTETDRSWVYASPVDGIYYCFTQDIADDFSAVKYEVDNFYTRYEQDKYCMDSYAYELLTDIEDETILYSEADTYSQAITLAPQKAYITAYAISGGECYWRYIAAEDGTSGWLYGLYEGIYSQNK